MMGCLLILGALAFAAGPAAADTTVSVGTVGTISVGDAFAVDVNIANVNDLYDFQLDLSFDPSIVQLNNVSEGAFLPQGGSTLFVPGFIDNVGGSATFNIDTLLGTIPGVNGSGVLLEFDFQALAAGTSSLSLSNILLQDSSPAGNDIDFSATDGSVTVESAGGGGPVTTPESGTLPLLFGALGGALVISALKRN
jgi:hypothetical protein